MAHVMNVVGDKSQVLSCAQLDKRHLSIMYFMARSVKPVLQCSVGVETNQFIARCWASQQDTRFFKALTYCSHPVRQTTVWNSQQCARLFVI